MLGVPGNEEKQRGVRFGAVAVTQWLVFFVFVSLGRIESGSEDSGGRVGSSCPSVWGCTGAWGCLPWHSVRYLLKTLAQRLRGASALDETIPRGYDVTEYG